MRKTRYSEIFIHPMLRKGMTEVRISRTIDKRPSNEAIQLNGSIDICWSGNL
jgi:hypothetical protein